MQYDEFVRRVQERTSLDSQAEALRLTRATLGTLGERIYRSARDDVAAQLPHELKEFLHARALPETTPKEVNRFSLAEFYTRVSARADVGYPQAVEGAKAVMTVLRQAIAAGEWADLGAELPDEYAEILTGPQEGQA